MQTPNYLQDSFLDSYPKQGYFGFLTRCRNDQNGNSEEKGVETDGANTPYLEDALSSNIYWHWFGLTIWRLLRDREENTIYFSFAGSDRVSPNIFAVPGRFLQFSSNFCVRGNTITSQVSQRLSLMQLISDPDDLNINRKYYSTIKLSFNSGLGRPDPPDCVDAIVDGCQKAIISCVQIENKLLSQLRVINISILRCFLSHNHQMMERSITQK